MERTRLLHIKNTNDNKYYVIKFLELPHEDINEIVCIPWMWIVSHKKRDLNIVALVSYPVENSSDTEKRVKEREKHSPQWKLYKAVVMYANDSYEAAKHFTTERMKEINEHNQSSNMKTGDHHESLALVEPTTTHTSERGAHSNQNIDNHLESKNDDSPALKRSKVVELAEEFNSPNENQYSPTVENPSNSSVEPRIIASREFFTEFFTLLQDLQTTPARDAAMVDRLRENLIQNAETMRKAAQLIDETRASLASSTITHEESASKGTSRKPKFVLPPEYDENDSRWTLKHRLLEPGLVELVPRTSVYIQGDKLIQCQRLAKDCNHFARLLAVEIFTKNALRVCSFTGDRAVAFDVDGSAVRPGLDKNARTALLKYVQDYGKKKGWKKVGHQSVRHSIYIKMHSMRKKYE